MVSSDAVWLAGLDLTVSILAGMVTLFAGTVADSELTMLDNRASWCWILTAWSPEHGRGIFLQGHRVREPDHHGHRL